VAEPDLSHFDRRWLSKIHDIRSFRGADCDTDKYLVVTKVRDSLAVGSVKKYGELQSQEVK
jgi:hypothetical protein